MTTTTGRIQVSIVGQFSYWDTLFLVYLRAMALTIKHGCLYWWQQVTDSIL